MYSLNIRLQIFLLDRNIAMRLRWAFRLLFSCVGFALAVGIHWTIHVTLVMTGVNHLYDFAMFPLASHVYLFFL